MKGEIDLEALERESEAILAAANWAVRRALIEHKQSGDPVVFFENGEVQWVPADEIVIPELPPTDSREF